jgi:SagB-type dehydrogenase family enzyme
VIAMWMVLQACALAGEEPLDLPPPTTDGEVSLEAALAQRRSVRTYTDQPLSDAEIGQLLWAAQGVTDASGKRTTPSAGASYPLEVYVATASGVYHYLPDGHRWQRTSADDPRPTLADAALGQPTVEDAPAVLVVTGVVDRTAAKYGARARRYVQLEAGHAAQNVLLQATALGLGAVPIGAFDDADVRRVLGLPTDHTPLYLVPVGHLPQ